MRRIERTTRIAAAAAILLLGTGTQSCKAGLGAGIGIKSPTNVVGTENPLSTEIPDKYENYFKKCEQYEKDIEEAKLYIEETPSMLAAKLDLEEGASLEQVTEAIRSRLQDQVVKFGVSIEVTIEGDVELTASASAGPEGASAEAGASAEVRVEIKVIGKLEMTEGLQDLFDTAKLAIERIVGSIRKLKALAEQVPELISEGKELAMGAEADIKNPATAAQVAVKLTKLTDLFGEVKGLMDVSFEMKVEIKASLTVEAAPADSGKGKGKGKGKGDKSK